MYIAQRTSNFFRSAPDERRWKSFGSARGFGERLNKFIGRALDAAAGDVIKELSVNELK